MGEMDGSKHTTGDGSHRRVPRWTLWEILGLIVSALLVVAPLLSLAYAFLFPPQAPAAPLWDTPVPITATPTPEPGTPTTAPTPVSPTPTWTPVSPTPTWTPIPPTPTWTPISPIPVSPTPCGDLTVDKAADKNEAYPGETIVFSIGLSNRTCDGVTVNLNDTLPAELHLVNVWHTCAGGSSISPGAGGFSAQMVVPAGQACQVVASTVVDVGCGCYVRNAVSWNGHTSYSQQIHLPLATVVPTPAPTTEATPTSTPVPTTAATPVPTTVVTPVPTTVVTPVPTTLVTPVPTTVATPVPTTVVTPVPTTVVTPVPTTVVTPIPTTVVTPVPTTAGTPVPTTIPTPGEPTKPPTPRPTERPPRSTPEPPPTQTPICAQARVTGQVCAAGVAVTISSCCPPWSAQTTSDGRGAFQFGGLTPGTFTLSARGISRTVKLEKCDSAVTVNLCPATPGPTPAETPVTAGPTVTTVAISPTVPIPTTPLVGGITLLLETIGGEDNIYRPGEALALRLTLHNGLPGRILRDVTVSATFDRALRLLGAGSPSGEISLSGQNLVLSGATLAAGNDLVVQVDAVVGPDVAEGTVVDLQATARTGAGDTVDSNVLRLEIWGAGVAAPAGSTALPAPPVVTPIGGPEPRPTDVPAAQPPIQAPALPPTSTGMPIVGIMLGGGVLLARQLRLRRAARRGEEGS